MPDPLASYIKHGFPDENDTESGYVTTIEYVGPVSVIYPAKPGLGDTWGDYQGEVIVSHFTPLERSNVIGEDPYGQLVVVLQLNYVVGEEQLGVEKETTYEIEWVTVERSLYEHPEFAPGGLFQLDGPMKFDIRGWEDEQDRDKRELFQYYKKDKNGNPTTTLVTLDPSAVYFCQHLLQGISAWPDFVPVARRMRTFVGGPPSESEAGSKEIPTGFPNLPTGYEWRKNADRSLRQGGQSRWTRSEEWTGAMKVLVDKDTLYLDYEIDP